mmetsp:Transcript_16076/g.35616  ORF Transcript_16076/g.35616 Transcript_16076/m.35616 type:complete len:262 (-) Transcript_16076:1232-2017(-)
MSTPGTRLRSIRLERFLFFSSSSAAATSKAFRLCMRSLGDLLEVNDESISASFLCTCRPRCAFLVSCSSSPMRQTITNALPRFLLHCPDQVCTLLCTISAMWFTNTSTSLDSFWLMSSKWWMSQKPKMAYMRMPGSSGFIAVEESLEERLAEMMPAPASPKPTRNRPVIFSIVVSSSLVSYCASAFPPSSSNWNVASGSSATASTMFIMRSIGSITKRCASLVNTMEPPMSITATNMVVTIEKVANSRTRGSMLYTTSVMK